MTEELLITHFRLAAEITGYLVWTGCIVVGFLAHMARNIGR